MSMGSRMFGFIFGDPTVKVEQKNPQPQCNSNDNANVNATSIENNCDYQIAEIFNSGKVLDFEFESLDEEDDGDNDDDEQD